jgi:uncharacterized protein
VSQVLLIGASTRAAAFSALRADLVPWCIDLFADADLLAVAEVRRCPFDHYPGCLPELIHNAPQAPLIYTGGLENYPRLIAELASLRPLWGNDAEALRRARDPFFVARLLNDNWLRCPTPGRQRPIGRALRKPLQSAGGNQITFATLDDRESDSFYFQQFIPGPSYAAVFCAHVDGMQLLGVTRQLIGDAWLHARPFHYCGSLGPVHLAPAILEQLMRVGDVVRTGCGLRGLFGIDFVLCDDHPWPVEINPRYTASIEIVEWATGVKALGQHRKAFQPVERRDESPTCSNASTSGLRVDARQFGKAILFAPARITFPDIRFRTESGPFARPDFADVPNPGEIIEEGAPIMTVLAEGATEAECLAELQRRAAGIMVRISSAGASVDCRRTLD